jgi:hypothetical protein
LKERWRRFFHGDGLQSLALAKIEGENGFDKFDQKCRGETRMSIPIVCPKCGKEWPIAETVLGRTIQCPRCESPFTANESATRENVVTDASADRPAARPRPAYSRDREEDNPEAYGSEPNRFRRPEDDAVSTIIPYKNGKALLSYYCGVFGIIPVLGLLLGPAALILGILGIRHVRLYPQAKGTAHAVVGIILGLFATLVNGGLLIFILVMLAAALYASPVTPPPKPVGPPATTPRPTVQVPQK